MTATAYDIGKQLVALCKEGKNKTVAETLYSPDIVSVEARAMEGGSAEVRGLKAIEGKSEWWAANHTVHSAAVEGPFPNGNRFIVRFTYDITHKPSSKRMTMDEMALFTVENGKIVREEYFYVTGG